MDPQAEQDDGAPSQEKIDPSIETTKESEATARAFSNHNQWRANRAVNADPQPSSPQNDASIEENQGVAESPSPADRLAGYTGTLDGRPVPQAEGSGSHTQSRKQAQGKTSNLKTLSDLHKEEDEVEKHHDEDTRGDLFAGGEKSGLAVQDPEDTRNIARTMAEDIVKNARRIAERGGPSAVAGPSQPRRFYGAGQTLGGDGVESRTTPAAQGSAIPRVGDQQTPRRQVAHTIHVWTDGFSINEGPLYSNAIEDNLKYLDLIKRNIAPTDIMDVDFGEEVDVKVQNHHQQPWHQLPYVYRPFSGQGRRLGSPVPAGISSTLDATVAARTTPPPTEVDESQPTVTIRIQLPNGTRVPARFNTTHTVADIYRFVQQTSPETRSRNWVLATTFPNKEHIDHSAVLGEMDEFKRGGTAVVKWV